MSYLLAAVAVIDGLALATNVIPVSGQSVGIGLIAAALAPFVPNRP